MFDLQNCFSYLFERISRAFAVTPSRRRFSSIALDQIIECTINKYGNGKSDSNGRLNEAMINDWTGSFAFRALAALTLHEICSVKTGDNSIDSHVECSLNRQILDDDDLSMIVKKLSQENPFSMINVECRKVQSGLIIHNGNKGSSNSENIEDFNTLVKKTDDEIRKTIIIAQQRNIKQLSQLFQREFLPVLFSLCNSTSINLLNQQTKVKVVDFLNKLVPSSFYSSCPTSTIESAVVIDDTSLLETKPQPDVQTIRQYANQLLGNDIKNLFKTYAEKCIYNLKADDKLESPFSKLVCSHGAAFTTSIKVCWMEQKLIGLLLKDRPLVVGGPDEMAIEITK
ncbi:unnamed protein product [Rotaria sp. Silwood2]|nr:unnamed protein product [Rotaria sp. Silwood2]CAF2622235.1 unnamed protein product [Rotaria sp. Silwood2]CAF2861224.1 unnamed protein product [Rotaria sp. Silwood2]CAF3885333.1 unnamed protein product [Rotaria sp. Silwood2]CAF3973033.1 unnamed protein product [Rotaria sp. Silwood2]